jgi:hypothetical protein
LKIAPRFILAASALILHVIAALSGRLFIASVVIAVRKRAVSMSEALFEIETPCSPSSLKNL